MKKAGIAYFTEPGRHLAHRIADGLSPEYEILWYKKGLKDWCADCFAQAELIIFIGACGIAVRTIAPLLKSKTEDPAVLVLDEAGQYVISLLSGHIGGANFYAQQIAGITGAVPVITTASDVRGKIAVDVFAKNNHLSISSMKAAKCVEAAILRGEPVEVYCSGEVHGAVPPELTLIQTKYGNELRLDESGSIKTSQNSCTPAQVEAARRENRVILTCQCKTDFSDENNDTGQNQKNAGAIEKVKTGTQIRKEKNGEVANYRIWISERACPWLQLTEKSMESQPQRDRKDQAMTDAATDPLHTLILTPRVVTIGIGCRKGKPAADVAEALKRILREEQIPKEALAGIASIDLKKDEEGILETAQEMGLPFITYTAEELLAVQGDFTPSEFVRKTTGVDNVCERSALLLAGDGGTIIRKKEAGNGVTVALAIQKWRIEF